MLSHPEEHRRAKAKAAELDISLAEYVRRLVARDLARERPGGDITVSSTWGAPVGPTSPERVGEHVAEAVARDYRRETAS